MCVEMTRPRRERRGRTAKACVVVIAAVLLLAGCSSASEAAAVDPATGNEPESSAPVSDSSEGDGAEAAPSDQAQADQAQADQAPSDEAPSEPETSNAAGESSGNPELDLLVDELSAYVEQERGLTFTSRPQIELLDDAAFGEAWVDLVADDAIENATSYRDSTDIYQALGIISADVTLEEIWIRFGEAGVIGYYETDSQAIVLRNGEINALARTTLVHELVHALEDQNFGLDRDAYDDSDDEINWAFSALAEGSARVIENRYRASLSESERAEEQQAIADLPRSVSFSEFNQSFLELQFGRYNYGETFADALWAKGQAALDEAFEEPPTASEQVLDPSSFIDRVPVDSPVAPPPAEGTVFEDGVWGEAAWIALLSDTFPTATALDLANGWGGDWFVAWRDGDATCVRIDVQADDADELAEYEAALSEWARSGSGRDLTSASEGLLRLTSCG